MLGMTRESSYGVGRDACQEDVGEFHEPHLYHVGHLMVNVVCARIHMVCV